jgi:hypothetical protein
MKTISKFVADDGVEFFQREECEKYEALTARIALVMSAFPAKPKDDGCNFANGHGYFQHEAATFYRVREALLLIAKEVTPHRWIDDCIADKNAHPSYVSRILGDYACRPLSDAWYRFNCIDSQLREWGQPYFAMNPKDGKLICLNATGAA